MKFEFSNFLLLSSGTDGRRIKTNMNRPAPSPSILELEGFLDGVIFSPEVTIRPVVQLKHPVAMTVNPPIVDEPSFVLLSKDVKYDTDIFCMRGQSGGKYPGNKLFRRTISSNKAYFDTLTAHEQESFAASLWSNLSLRHRFLRPMGGGYEVLNHDKSVKKCHHALVSCRTGSVEKLDSQQPPMNFDDVAKDAIATLLSRQEIVDAMNSAWKSDAERKRKMLEEKVRQPKYATL